MLIVNRRNCYYQKQIKDTSINFTESNFIMDKIKDQLNVMNRKMVD